MPTAAVFRQPPERLVPTVSPAATAPALCDAEQARTPPRAQPAERLTTYGAAPVLARVDVRATAGRASLDGNHRAGLQKTGGHGKGQEVNEYSFSTVTPTGAASMPSRRCWTALWRAR